MSQIESHPMRRIEERSTRCAPPVLCLLLLLLGVSACAGPPGPTTTNGQTSAPGAATPGAAFDDRETAPSEADAATPDTPSPMVIEGAHVIARAPSAAPDGTPLAFELWEFENRIWVSLCLAPFGQGCVQPEILSLEGDGWLPDDTPLRGLPPLEIVNLYALPKSPFAGVGHEADRPRSEGREACLYDRLYEGTRSIAAVAGDYPRSAWMVVRLALDHSGSPVDDLYVWRDGWRRIFAGRAYGDAVVALVPWSGGVAAVLAKSRPVEERDAYSLVFFSGGSRRALVPWQARPIRVGVARGALIAVSAVGGNEYDPVALMRLRRWEQPTKGPTLEDIVGFDGADRLITEPLPSPADAPIVEEPEFPGQPLLRLPEPYHRDADIVQDWTLRGRRFWLVQLEGPDPDWLLLSDQPTREVRSPTPPSARLPRVPRCEALPEGASTDLEW